IEDLGLALVDRSAPFHEKSLSFAFAALDRTRPFRASGRAPGCAPGRNGNGALAEDDGPVVRELSEARPLGQRARGHGGKGSLRLSHSPASLAIVALKDARFAKYYRIIRGL